MFCSLVWHKCLPFIKKLFMWIISHTLCPDDWVFAVTELDPKLSGLIWTAMFGSLALVTMVGVNPFAIRTFFISTIFRFIFSVGLEYTLWLLGAFNVSTKDIVPISKAES